MVRRSTRNSSRGQGSSDASHVPESSLSSLSLHLSSSPASQETLPPPADFLGSSEEDVGPLAGLCLLIEVFCGGEDRRTLVKKDAEALGADTASRLSARVTHLVFLDGNRRVLLSVRERPRVHAVSLGWLHECRRLGKRADETLFPALRETELAFQLPKPKTGVRVSLGSYDEEAAKSSQRLRALQRRDADRRRSRRVSEWSATSSQLLSSSSSPGASAATYGEELRRLREQVRALTQPRRTGTGRSPATSTPSSPSYIKLRPSRSSARHESSQLSSASSYSMGPVEAGLPSPRRRLVLTQDTGVNTTASLFPQLAQQKMAANTGDPLRPSPPKHPKMELRSPGRGLPEKENELPAALIKNPSVSQKDQGQRNQPARRDSLDEVISQVKAMTVAQKKKATKEPKEPRKKLSRPGGAGASKKRKTPAVKKVALPSLDVSGSAETAAAAPVPRKRKTAPRPRPRSSLFRILTESESSRLGSEDEMAPRRLPRASLEAPKTVAGRGGPPATIVFTFMRAEEKEAGLAAVSALGGFVLRSAVDAATTHVICGDKRRTLAVLRGIAIGAWILPLSWVLESLEAERWLREDDFELAETFPGAKTSRETRELGMRSSVVLKTESLYVSRLSKPPPTELEQIIRLAGGITFSSMARASLCLGPAIGDRWKDLGKTFVSETWLLDSLSLGLRQPIEPYILPSDA